MVYLTLFKFNYSIGYIKNIYILYIACDLINVLKLSLN